MDFDEFMRLKGCTSCVHFPGPYFKDNELESPSECYYCLDSLTRMYNNYRRKKFI
ncbi:hypothetical protein [[Eubacterium] cellulosolvens]